MKDMVFNAISVLVLMIVCPIVYVTSFVYYFFKGLFARQD